MKRISNNPEIQVKRGNENHREMLSGKNIFWKFLTVLLILILKFKRKFSLTYEKRKLKKI